MFEQVATVMAATARIAAVTQIDPSYSPFGAIVHPHLIRGWSALQTTSLLVRLFQQQ